jgi:hypothetical protein
MPAFLIEQGATVLCTHGGQASPAAPNPRVTLGGKPSCLITTPWLVAGCPGIPAAFIPPCVTAQWIIGTMRVTSSGQPFVVMSGVAIAMPPGTPLQLVVTQTRVIAT